MTILEELGARALLEEIKSGFGRLEGKMADLTQAVNDLRAAVTGVADRVGSMLEPLRTALEEAQAQLATERATNAEYRTTEENEDVEQNRVLSETQASVDAKIQEALNAANEIEVEVGRLNDVAKAPEPAPEDPNA